MYTLVERNNFGRLILFCAKHLTPHLVQTLHSSSCATLTWSFASTTTTTFKHAWVENLVNPHMELKVSLNFGEMEKSPTRLMRPW